MQRWRDRSDNRKSAKTYSENMLSKKVHCKKKLSIFPSPGGVSLTKLLLAGNNQIFPGQGEFGQWHPGSGRENRETFLQCTNLLLAIDGLEIRGTSAIVINVHYYCMS